jgi:hypothetical protein
LFKLEILGKHYIHFNKVMFGSGELIKVKIESHHIVLNLTILLHLIIIIVCM